MNPEDNEAANQTPDISSRPPFLPPATSQQAVQALLSPDSLSYVLIHHVQPWHEPGLAESLVQGTQPGQAPEPGLAAALASHGITSLPDADPRLVNITKDPQMPRFQTTLGTVIQMNKPAPATTLPWGEGLDRLARFADRIGTGQVKINGGDGGARSESENPTAQHESAGLSPQELRDRRGARPEGIRHHAEKRGAGRGIYPRHP